MLNKDQVKKRLDALKAEGKERFEELRTEGKERFEELKVEGSGLAGKVRDIIDEGKARKITIKKGDRVLAEFPLAVGVGGAAAAVLLAPTLAAVGAIGTLVSDVEVVIHRDPDPGHGEEVRTVEYSEVDE
jgi:hypothetical protein